MKRISLVAAASLLGLLTLGCASPQTGQEASERDSSAIDSDDDALDADHSDAAATKESPHLETSTSQRDLPAVATATTLSNKEALEVGAILLEPCVGITQDTSARPAVLSVVFVGQDVKVAMSDGEVLLVVDNQEFRAGEVIELGGGLVEADGLPADANVPAACDADWYFWADRIDRSS